MLGAPSVAQANKSWSVASINGSDGTERETHGHSYRDDVCGLRLHQATVKANTPLSSIHIHPALGATIVSQRGECVYVCMYVCTYAVAEVEPRHLGMCPCRRGPIELNRPGTRR